MHESENGFVILLVLAILSTSLCLSSTNKQASPEIGASTSTVEDVVTSTTTSSTTTTEVIPSTTLATAATTTTVDLKKGAAQEASAKGSSTIVKFRLINGLNKQPIKNWKVLICNYTSFADCVKGRDWFIEEVQSDPSGVFTYDISVSGTDIWFNLGKTYYSQVVERTNELGAVSYNPGYLKVAVMEKGNLRRNRIYDLKSRQVTTIELEGNESTDSFDTVDLIF